MIHVESGNRTELSELMATTTAAREVASPITRWLRCGCCHHLARRSPDPWDNQYRCDEGCRCTMQGCCGATAEKPVTA